MNNRLITTLSILGLILLTACSGGGGSSTPVTSFELLDPIAAANNKFGTKVAILPNGNIVIAAPNDSSVALNSGAVHLYNPYTQTRLASFYGDTANDQLGSSGVTALANNNFVIASAFDDETVVDGGTVRLVNGTTGVQINMLAGDMANDKLGISSITALTNNNYVIASENDDENSIVNAGSVRQMDGSTGNPIRTIIGSVAGDINSPIIIDSPKNDFYIISLPNKDNNSMVDSGFVTLIARPVLN